MLNIAQLYFRKKRRVLEQIADFRVLLISLVVVNTIIMGIFLIALSRAQVKDPKVSVTPLSAAQLTEKKKIVKVHFLANSFSKFDVLKNDFIMNGTIRFLFDKNQVNPTLIDQFSFENATILSKSAPYQYVLEHDNIAVNYDIRLELKGNFDHHYYPFDYHRLDFILVNKQATIDQLIYVTNDNDLMLKEGAFTQDWTKFGQATAFGTASFDVHSDHEMKKISYERVIFSFDFKRTSIKQIFIVFLPLFLIFFIGLLSLTFDVMSQFPVILTLSLGSTTGLIFYSNQLIQASPVTGIFTLADMIYTLLLTIIITTLTLQIATMHYLYRKQTITQLKELLNYTAMSLNIIRGIFFLFFLLLMLVTVAWLLLL